MSALRDILAVPFGWALSFCYNNGINYLLSLVIITLIVRLILLPSSIKQQKNSAKQMRLQAKVNKIRAKYAGNNSRENQMKISEETQELYKREGFNASTQGCLPMALTLIVMMGLYRAIYSPISRVLGFSEEIITALTNAYVSATGIELTANSSYRIELDILNKFSDVVKHLDPGIVSQTDVDKIQKFIDEFNIFGINLTELPKDFKTIGWTILLIPIFAGLSALLTSLYTYLKQRKTNPEMAKNPAMGCMTFFSPVISIVFAYTLPAGVGFYWIISGFLSFIQTVALGIAFKPQNVIAGQMIDETVTRRAREKSVKERNAVLARHRDSEKN